MKIIFVLPFLLFLISCYQKSPYGKYCSDQKRQGCIEIKNDGQCVFSEENKPDKYGTYIIQNDKLTICEGGKERCMEFTIGDNKLTKKTLTLI